MSFSRQRLGEDREAGRYWRAARSGPVRRCRDEPGSVIFCIKRTNDEEAS